MDTTPGAALARRNELTLDDRPKKSESERAREARAATVRKFLELAHKRFQTSKNGLAELHANQKDDQKFAAGSVKSGESTQWSADTQSTRAAEFRPCITINRQPAFIRQVTGEMRQTPQSIKVSPFDNDADPKTAEVFQGLIRQIESNSDADVVFYTAGDSQARVGLGWVKIIAKYVSDRSFDQDLFLKRIPNPFAVFPDPSFREFDGSDMTFLFEVEDLLVDEYLHRFRHVLRTVDGFALEESEIPTAASFEAFGLPVEYAADWAPTGKVKIARYWFVDYVPDVALLLENGRVVLKSECQAVAETEVKNTAGAAVGKATYATIEGEGGQLQDVKVLKTRRVNRQQFKVAVIDGLHILEGNEDLTDGAPWVGDRIPYYPVIGEELNVDGKVDYRGVVRDNKEGGRAYNYMVTGLVEQIMLAPRAPWLVDVDSIAGFDAFWKTANAVNHAYLPFRSTNQKNPEKPLPAPERTFGEPSAIGAIVMAIRQFDNDQKAVTGFYDASLGEKGPEQSGRAIFARQQQSNTGSAHYPENMKIARRAVARSFVQLIPFYYDAGRIARITGLDGKQRQVYVYAGQQNKPTPEEEAQILQKLGVPPPAEGASDPVQHIFDLDVGRYDVTVDSGPSFATLRQEGASTMVELAKVLPPPHVAAGADLMVANMDFPGADQLSQRYKKMLSPDLKDDDEQRQGPTPQEAAQAQQLINLLTERLNALADERDIKKLELESKENIATIQADAQMAIAAMRAESTEALALFQARLDEIHTFLEGKQRERDREVDAAQQQAAAAASQTPAAPAGGMPA